MRSDALSLREPQLQFAMDKRAFRIVGLTWIVESTFAWLGRNRRFSEDYEYCVQTSETMIDIGAASCSIELWPPDPQTADPPSRGSLMLAFPVSRWPAIRY